MRLLALLVSALLSFSICAQSTVTPYAIEIANAEYSISAYKGTRIMVWVDTKDQSFVQLLPETSIDLKDAETGQSILALGDEMKKEWEEENKKLAKQGRFRSSSRMEELTIGRANFARDTTGFVFEINSPSPPPSGVVALQMVGVIHYLASTDKTEFTSVQIANLFDQAYNYKTQDFNGSTLEFRRTGTTRYGEEYEYDALLDGKPVAGLSLDGKDYNSTFFLKDQVAKNEMEIFLKLVGTETKKVDVDLKFGAGL